MARKKSAGGFLGFLKKLAKGAAENPVTTLGGLAVIGLQGYTAAHNPAVMLTNPEWLPITLGGVAAVAAADSAALKNALGGIAATRARTRKPKASATDAAAE